MDEDELVKVGMEVTLAPITGVLENVLGLLGGDALSEARKRNRRRLESETEQIFKDRGIKDSREVPPAVMLPLLSAAQDENREELLRLYAKLLTAAADPARIGDFRREFIDIARELEPHDILVLKEIEAAGGTAMAPTRVVWIATKLQLSNDNVENAVAALARLGLLNAAAGMNPQAFPILTSKSRQFLKAIAG